MTYVICLLDGVSKVFCVLRTQAGVERVWDVRLPAGRLGLTCSMTPFMLAHCKALEHLGVKSLQLSCSPQAYFATFAWYKVSLLLSSNNSFLAAYAGTSGVGGLYDPCNKNVYGHFLQVRCFLNHFAACAAVCSKPLTSASKLMASSILAWAQSAMVCSL